MLSKWMGEALGIILVCVFLVLSGLAVLVAVRAFIRGVRGRGALPYRPIPLIFPPIPVKRTTGVILIGAVAMAWSAGHLLMVAYWSVTGYPLPQTVAAWLAAAYVCVAAVIVGVGGWMLLGCRPFGRRLISWGMMLLGLLGFFALIIAMLLPKYEDAPMWVRRLAVTIAFLMAGHVLLDTAVGALGQKVGREGGSSRPVA